jgi:hypothetical protein
MLWMMDEIGGLIEARGAKPSKRRPNADGMKPTVSHLVFLVVIIVGGGSLYLEQALRGRGWSRDSLVDITVVAFAVAYLGWRAWRWWHRRDSN